VHLDLQIADLERARVFVLRRVGLGRIDAVMAGDRLLRPDAGKRVIAGFGLLIRRCGRSGQQQRRGQDRDDRP